MNSPVINRHDVHPLQVLGTGVRFLCTAHSTGGAFSLMEVELPVDAGPPAHHHRWDEAYYVLAGEVEFSIAGQQVVAKAGDFIHTPGGVMHGFRGLSAQPARLLIVDAPAHAAAFFERVDREVGELPRDLPKVLEIGAATGIHFAAAVRPREM